MPPPEVKVVIFCSESPKSRDSYPLMVRIPAMAGILLLLSEARDEKADIEMSTTFWTPRMNGTNGGARNVATLSITSRPGPTI